MEWQPHSQDQSAAEEDGKASVEKEQGNGKVGKTGEAGKDGQANVEQEQVKGENRGEGASKDELENV